MEKTCLHVINMHTGRCSNSTLLGWQQVVLGGAMLTLSHNRFRVKEAPTLTAATVLLPAAPSTHSFLPPIIALLTLNDVGGQREWSTHKAEHGGGVAHLGAQLRRPEKEHYAKRGTIIDR